MARDRWGLRRTFRTPPGRSAVSWRWEVGLPLFVLGFLTALLTGDGNGANVLFWAAAVVAGIGAALFFSGMLRR
jgi:predicted membrane metal-binding protein